MRSIMRPIRLLFMAFLVMALFYSSGCKGVFSPSDNIESQGTFRTGTQGIELRFVQGSPPSDVYEGDRMDAVVEYTNRGAFDIESGYLYLSGFDKNYIRFDRTMLAGMRAKGKDEFNPLGDIINTFTFSVDQVNIPNDADLFPQTIKATACYKYRTYAVGRVCIDPDPYGVGYQDKVCIAGAPEVGGSQGAPVAVTSVVQQSAKNRVQFKVNVANVGSGAVIDNAAPIVDCHSKLDRTDIDKVDIKAKFSDNWLKCEPETVRISEGAGFAICHWEGDLGPEAYETMLTIQLDYGYRDSMATDVTIHRLPGKYTYS